MKVLIAYATKHGSTAEIAGALADTLRASGLEVDCLPASDADSPDSYDAVLLGSAVYMKRWRKAARRYLRKNQKALGARPFWVFSSGPVGDPADDDPEWMEPQRIIERVERLGGRGHVVFGGRLPLEPRGPIEKAMVKGTPAEFHDRRDWDEIRAWAERTAAEIQEGPAAGRES